MLDFKDISGQDSAIERLCGMHASSRRPASMIFSGPKGVGRTTTALAYAKLLLCQEPIEDNQQIKPCCNCRSCLMMDQSSHPDFHLVTRQLASFSSDSRTRIAKQQSLPINVVREFLIDPANSASNCGKGRVFVVREAETLALEAQNALLKTLEEPPKNVTVILSCSCEHDLLPTIRSRCALVRFSALHSDFIVERLGEAGCDQNQGLYWARLSGGSLGRSLSLYESELYEFKCDLLSRLAAGGDVALADDMVAICDKLAAKEVSANKNLAESVAKRWAGRTILELLCAAFCDAMAISIGSRRALVNSDQAECIHALAGRFDTDHLADAVEQMLRYEQLLWRNLNQKVLWDNVAITCITAAPLKV